MPSPMVQKHTILGTPIITKKPKQTSSVNLVNNAISAKVSSTTDIVKSSMTQAKLLNSEKLTKPNKIAEKIGTYIFQFTCPVQILS